LKKAEPQLVREDLVKGNFQRFMAHIETREVPKPNSPIETKYKSKPKKSKESVSSRSKSNSDSDAANKDNEDPGTTALESKADHFDPKELREFYDGWSLYKKTRISNAPVRRYQMMVDQDYKRNKVTVCAHLQNIYNSWCLKRGRPTW
jgi:hypothetical protein